MRSHRKIAAALVVLLSLAIAAKLSSSAHGRATRWEVLVNTLPQRISTQDAHINTVYYALRQTHEPILRKDDGQNYTSRILKSWTHDLGYLRYTFCPATGLIFDGDRGFSADSFRDHILKITGKYSQNFDLKPEGDCSVVSFSTPHKSYLDYLTLLENAPTISSERGSDIGLGPFYVAEVEKERVVLLRKKPVRNSYSEVILHLYKDVGDPMLQNRNVSDFNLIPTVDVPEWVKKEYLSFDNVELKSGNLIINHPDLKARRLIRNCLDVDRFRRAYAPRKKDFLDLQTILPLGLIGAESGLPRQNCDSRMFNVRLSTPIVFYNNRDDNEEQLKELAADFKKRTGVPLHIAKYPADKIAAIKRQRPRPFNLIVIVIDAVTPNYEAFFDPFLDASGYHDFDTTVLRQLRAKLEKTDSVELKSGIAKLMIDDLERQSAVLTLYQMRGRLYYPKGIKNIEVGRGFLQYPEVADFRW